MRATTGIDKVCRIRWWRSSHKTIESWKWASSKKSWSLSGTAGWKHWRWEKVRNKRCGSAGKINLPMPRTGVSQEYYRRQLWIHNFCIHECVEEKATMFLYSVSVFRNLCRQGSKWCNTLPAALRQISFTSSYQDQAVCWWLLLAKHVQLSCSLFLCIETQQ